jgi:hypothetical protein
MLEAQWRGREGVFANAASASLAAKPLAGRQNLWRHLLCSVMCALPFRKLGMI